MTEKYYTLKENAVWNIPADLMTGTRITVDLDGKTVEAYVRVDVKNLMVMVSDLKWFCIQHSHIMYMCPRIYTRKNVSGSPANQYAVMRIKDIILDLYFDNLCVEENMDQIKDCLVKYNQHLDSIGARIESLEDERRAIRKAHREGESTQEEYKSNLHDFYARLAKAKEHKRRAFDEYFASVKPLFRDSENLYEILEDLTEEFA